MHPLQSMTGFGSARATAGDCHIRVDVRCVNSRFFDVRARIPDELAHLTPALHRLLRERMQRGRADVSLRWEQGPTTDAPLVQERLEQLVRQVRESCTGLDPQEAAGVFSGVLSQATGLFRKAAPERAARERATQDGATQDSVDPSPAGLGDKTGEGTDDPVDASVMQAAGLACERASAMRRKEGASLACALLESLAACAGHAEQLSAQAQRHFESEKQRLSTFVETALPDMDESKRIREIVAWADKYDVREEVVRLQSHFKQMEETCRDEKQQAPRGRRIDFLLQEMVREVNTIGSKISSAEITHGVVELKSELERMREQAQNVL